ncbi:hypothetical protein [Streptomyces arenae]|uniref:hypothetical protein n=1 Tax=Streptomyces arenae TaxID=29301 RepID=UPI00265807D2|nr:hypothetical protein [Streptomyces arenae]MCG7205737.1 hypothetical protein [Streptomyces arenae]
MITLVDLYIVVHPAWPGENFTKYLWINTRQILMLATQRMVAIEKMLEFGLNLLFGAVGIVGFGFAVWQWKQSETTRKVMNRSLEALVSNAQLYEMLADSQAGEMFASQVQRQCAALISQPVQVGRYFVRFFPGEESSCWLTELGLPQVEPGERGASSQRITLWGKALRDGTDKLVYGPHETLPLRGSYRVDFRFAIKAGPDNEMFRPMVRIDVNGADSRLAEKVLLGSQVSNEYEWYSLTFRYADIKEKLEYRVALLQKDTEGKIYDVIVRYLGG